jgi:hypothetical protein
MGSYFKIPDELLQNAGQIRIYGCNDKHTLFEQQFAIIKKPKPIDYIYTEE